MEPTGGDLARHDREFDSVRWLAFADAPNVLTFETERALVARAAELSMGSGVAAGGSSGRPAETAVKSAG